MPLTIRTNENTETWLLEAPDHTVEEGAYIIGEWCYSEADIRSRGGYNWQDMLYKLVGLRPTGEKCKYHYGLQLFRLDPEWEKKRWKGGTNAPIKIDDPWNPTP